MDFYESDDDYNYDSDEYRSVEPSHVVNYNGLHEPSQKPIDLLRQAIINGDVQEFHRILDVLSPMEQSLNNGQRPEKGVHSVLSNGNKVGSGGDGLKEEEEDEEQDGEGANVDAPTKEEIFLSNGWTPIIQAAHLGLHEMLDLLIRYNYSVNTSSHSGSPITPLIAACAPHTPNFNRRTASGGATIDHDRCVSLLLAAGAEITAESDSLSGQANQPLHYAASSGRHKSILLLVQAGASVNARNKLDQTPLMLAAEQGHLRAVSCLHHECGALLGLEDRSGHTASYVASLAGHCHLADTLSVLSGEAAKDDRLYRAWGLLREALENGEEPEEDKSVKSASRYDDLASFCYGLNLGHVLPIFRHQGITIADLRIMSDSKLMEIGVDKFQDRKRILDLVQEMHKKPWKDEDSLPKFDYGRPLKPLEMMDMIGNTARHLEFIDATISYMENHIRTNTSLYVQEARDVPHSIMSRLSDKCDQSLDSSRRLFASLGSLRRSAQLFQEASCDDVSPELIGFESPDLLIDLSSTTNTSRHWGSSLLLAGTLTGATLALVWSFNKNHSVSQWSDKVTTFFAGFKVPQRLL